MALPEDFNKIYGSTATGGLTPINDVNYAKGWEFVGANPPTKNDFSYLQNLSDQKSQWLYSNKLQRSDPFGDIKSDGAAAVAAALANLGLKTAALRDVGTSTNQIPDMSAFPAGLADYGYVKLPNGFMLQWRTLTIAPATDGKMRTSSAGWAATFPTAVLAAVCSLSGVTTYDTTKTGFVSSSVTTTGFTLGSGYTSSNSNVTIIALGY